MAGPFRVAEYQTFDDAVDGIALGPFSFHSFFFSSCFPSRLICGMRGSNPDKFVLNFFYTPQKNFMVK